MMHLYKSLIWGSFIYFMSITNLTAQYSLKKRIESGSERVNSYYINSKEPIVKYLEFNDFIIRGEGNDILLLDEKLEVANKTKLVEDKITPQNNFAYKYVINNDYLVIKQSQYNSSNKLVSLNLFRIDLFDFSNLKRLKVPLHKGTNQYELLLTSRSQYLSFNYTMIDFDHLITKSLLHFKINDNFELEEQTENPLYIIDGKEGYWNAFYVYNDTIRGQFFEKNNNGSYNNYLCSFDEDLEIQKYVKLYTSENGGIHTEDQDGNSAIMDGYMFVNSTTFDTIPYLIPSKKGNIWIKDSYNYSWDLVNWVSFDGENFNLNLSERIKTQAKEIGLKKIAFSSSPVIMKNPMNGGMTLKFFSPIYKNTKFQEKFTFINLDSNCNVQSIYISNSDNLKASVMGKRHVDPHYNRIKQARSEIEFNVGSSLKIYSNETNKGRLNAFDYIFQNENQNEFCTIITTAHSQYLFIDHKDGSTAGYIFK